MLFVTLGVLLPIDASIRPAGPFLRSHVITVIFCKTLEVCKAISLRAWIIHVELSTLLTRVSERSVQGYRGWGVSAALSQEALRALWMQRGAPATVTRPQEQHLLSSPPSFSANMATAEEGQFLKQATGRNTRGLLRVVILCLIAGAAVSSRLFSVIRFESIIHECQYHDKLRIVQLANGMAQSTHGSTFEPRNTLYRMASTASGTGSMTVRLSSALPAYYPYIERGRSALD